MHIFLIPALQMYCYSPKDFCTFQITIEVAKNAFAMHPKQGILAVKEVKSAQEINILSSPRPTKISKCGRTHKAILH